MKRVTLGVVLVALMFAQACRFDSAPRAFGEQDATDSDTSNATGSWDAAAE